MILPLHCIFYVCIGGAVAVITRDKGKGGKYVINKCRPPRSPPPPYPQYPASQPIRETKLIQLWFLPTPHVLSLAFSLSTEACGDKRSGEYKGGGMQKRQDQWGRERKKQQEGMWKCCGEVDIMTYGLHVEGVLTTKWLKQNAARRACLPFCGRRKQKAMNHEWGRMVIKQKTACLEDSLHPRVLVRPSVVCFHLEPDNPPPAERSK